MADRQRLFVDMDGTLAVFTPVDELETLYEKGYFGNLEPHENVVSAVREIIENHPEIEVHVLSAYLTDSQYALQEKNEWLDKYLPEIDQAHRVFVPCGSDKKEGIEGGVRPDDFLLDDYTHNLNDWQPPARGIKLLNAINHTRGSWEHDRIRYDRDPSALADGIVAIMQGRERIFDERINVPMEQRERDFIENLARLEYMRGESVIFPAYEPLSVATNPTAREVYQAEVERLQRGNEEARLVVLTSEMVGYRNAPHDVVYNRTLTDAELTAYRENQTAFLEEMYARLGNRDPQPSDYYGHSPSTGDAFVVMTQESTESHYVDTVGFEREADLSIVMTPEQQRAASMGITAREELALLESLDEYAHSFGNEELAEIVETETMGRLDFLHDEFTPVFNLAAIREVAEREQDKLATIYEYENNSTDPLRGNDLVGGVYDGRYQISRDAIRAAMPDSRLANGRYVYDDTRVIAGERLQAEIDRRFDRATQALARTNSSFYRFEASPTPLGEQGQYDAFVQRYDRSGNGTAIPRDIVYIGEAKRAAEVAQFLNAGQTSEYGSALLQNVELRRQNGALPMQGREADREAVAEYLFNGDKEEQGRAGDGIKIDGHVGTWHIVDQTQRELPHRNGEQDAFYLLEHDTYGEDAAMLIVNKESKVVLDDVWNGFDDLDEAIDDFAYTLQVLEEAGYTVVSVTDTMGCELEDNDTLIRGFVNYNDLTEHEGELVEAHYNKTVEAMEVAGYHLDIYESNSRNPIYNYDGQTTPLRFDSLKENMEWLDGVVFDSPEISNAVERIMHPNRFEDTAEPNLVTVQAASRANYTGMVVLSQFDRDGRGENADAIYLGKTENYNGRGVYDNSDNSLVHISDNPKMFSFLDASEGWAVSQQEMIDNGVFAETDYAEFARLKEGVLSQFEEITPKRFEVNVLGEDGNGVPFRYPDWEQKESIKGVEQVADKVSHDANEERMGNRENYRFFYDNEVNPERKELLEQGWKQFWGSDEQGLNGGTWVVYRDVSDLPEFLQDFAREMEQYQPMPNHYYEPDLDLDGTADELFTQARNGYIESPEALAKLQEILSNPVENKTEQAFYVGVLKEIAEDKGEEPYVFAQMKKDILDGVHPEEVSLRDGLTLEVLRDGNDSVVIDLRDYSAEDDASFIGGHSMSQDEFLNMTAKEFKELVNSVYAYNMVQEERGEDLERPFEKVTIDGHECNVVDAWIDEQDSYVLGNDIEDSSFYYAIVNSDASNTFEYDTKPTREQVEDDFLNRESQRALDNYEAEFGADGRRAFPNLNEEPTEKLTLHIQYKEPINMNGWVAETDTITFDSREELDKFVGGDAAYDALDNAVSRKDNEILLYAENEQGEKVWSSPEYERQQKEATLAKWAQLSEIDKAKTICFDVETTGLDRKEDEILQLSIMDGNQNVLFSEYIRPTEKQSWEQAEAIHGISPAMVADKSTMEAHRDRLNEIFANAELMVGYNHEYFDTAFLKNAGIEIPENLRSFDVMKEYAPIHGEWNEEKGDYKWQKLAVCAEHYGFEQGGNYHDALSDVRATLHSFYGMVEEQKREVTNMLAHEALADRIEAFIGSDIYKQRNTGIIDEFTASKAELVEMLQSKDVSQLQGVIQGIQNVSAWVSNENYADAFTNEIREANDIVYSLEHLDQYEQYFDRNTPANADVAIREFRADDGRLIEGNQIPMVMSQTPNFSDRSIVFHAVQDFEEANNLPENQRVIHDGSYEDKEFLYMGYDEHLAASHQNDLALQPYMERINELTVGREYQYASPLPMVAEVYYAQQNNLTTEQIDYALDYVKEDKYPSDTFRNVRRGFENGLSVDQMEIIKGEKESTQEYLLGFMSGGGSLEDARALKGCDTAQYYLLSDPLKKGEISREMAQGIIQTVNGMMEQSRADFDAQHKANPEAQISPRFHTFDGEYFTEYFADAAIADKNITPEMVATVAKEFMAQTEVKSLSKFVEERGGFAAVSHDAKSEKVVDMPVESVEDKKTKEGISLPEEKKDPKEKLTEQLQQGVRDVLNSENFKSWLDTSSKLFMNNYSFNNAMLVWMQKPDATHTMGFEQWKDYGRSVAKGAEGIKIFVPVIAYEKKDGDLWRMIKNNLGAQFKNNPKLEQAVYRVGQSKLEITMNPSGLYGLRVDGKEQGIRSEQAMQDFIKHSVVGKVPMYFSVGTVFDVKDTVVPEYLWVKKGYKKEELVQGEDGKPIKNSKTGAYKIVNTPERQARFNPTLDMSVEQKDPTKMAILYDALKAVSERNGIPVFEKERDADDTLKNGADGYYARDFSADHPKGYIVMPTDLDPTKAVSVTIHEMAHSKMHGNLEKLAQEMGEDNIPRKWREVQAEAVAYTVGKQFGIDTDTSSFQYLAAYTQGFELQALTKSIEVIYKECQQISKELEAELAVRGLNRDLSDRSNEPMEVEAMETISKAYAEYTVTQMERFGQLETTLPALANQNAENKEALAVVVEQAKNVERQKEDVGIICNELNALQEGKTLDAQQEAIGKIEAAKARVEESKVEFASLESKLSELMKNDPTLKNRFVTNPMQTLESMKGNYPQLAQLTTSQLQYIAKSEYVSRELVPMLRNDTQQFVDKACERASQIDKVASKNGMFVEVAFCEQWTDKPIFNKGALMHPNVANAIVKQAEVQIRGLKRDAEKTGDYFPYTKCVLTVFQAEKGQITSAFKTRIDIGDGEQTSLTNHLKQFAGTKDFAADFEKATREGGAKGKILFNDSHGATTVEVAEQGDGHASKTMSREEWAQEIGKVKESMQENAKNQNQQEQTANRNNKDDKAH